MARHQWCVPRIQHWDRVTGTRRSDLVGQLQWGKGSGGGRDGSGGDGALVRLDTGRGLGHMWRGGGGGVPFHGLHYP